MGDDDHIETLPAFQISRYPVTVAEYACFVRTGQREPGYWRSQLNKLDHPVVYISWRTAAAYAAWIAERTGQLWRLPSEKEWEKAARGTDGRMYPWGSTFDPARCTTQGSGIGGRDKMYPVTQASDMGGTTSIGSYPASDLHRSGASPYGVEELAGNVWEWTWASGKNSIDIRVLHGGSWYNGGWIARAAYRSLYPPDFSFNIGFRWCGRPHSKPPARRLYWRNAR